LIRAHDTSNPHRFADSRPFVRRSASAVGLVLGAAIYALALGVVGLTFNATPLIVGLVAIGAGLAGTEPRLVAIGLTLVGWGSAVLLVRDGPLPHNREAAVFLVGAGFGFAAATGWARIHRSANTVGPALALIVGALAFYAAFDINALNHWPIWTLALVIWAATDFIRQRRL
jgi:hypothetical protein